MEFLAGILGFPFHAERPGAFAACGNGKPGHIRGASRFLITFSASGAVRSSRRSSDSRAPPPGPVRTAAPVASISVIAVRRASCGRIGRTPAATTARCRGRCPTGSATSEPAGRNCRTVSGLVVHRGLPFVCARDRLDAASSLSCSEGAGTRSTVVRSTLRRQRATYGKSVRICMAWSMHMYAISRMQRTDSARAVLRKAEQVTCPVSIHRQWGAVCFRTLVAVPNAWCMSSRNPWRALGSLATFWASVPLSIFFIHFATSVLYVFRSFTTAAL
jgi:hypothetical protein